MRSAYNVHREFGGPNLRRKAGLALTFIVVGSIAGASGIVLQMAGDGPNAAARSEIAAIPLNPSPALSTVVSPAFPAVSASDNRQSESPSNSAQPAAVAVAATAPPTTSATGLSQQRVAASKKSQKTARSQNRRERGWYDASARRQQYADYGRGRSYGNERPSSSW
jgi:hypothetical protein